MPLLHEEFSVQTFCWYALSTTLGGGASRSSQCYAGAEAEERGTTEGKTCSACTIIIIMMF